MSHRPIVFIGLGNPGGEYAKTRHNVGFLLIDSMCQGLDLPNLQEKLTCHGVLLSHTLTKDRKIYFFKPTTYMNLSGKAVQALCGFFKLSPQDLIVLHDDIDLNVGVVKIKQGGGSAGHNGIKSIAQSIGHDFIRVRYGIGRPLHEQESVSDFVLGSMASQDIEHVCAYGYRLGQSLKNGKHCFYHDNVALKDIATFMLENA